MRALSIIVGILVAVIGLIAQLLKEDKSVVPSHMKVEMVSAPNSDSNRHVSARLTSEVAWRQDSSSQVPADGRIWRKQVGQVKISETTGVSVTFDHYRVALFDSERKLFFDRTFPLAPAYNVPAGTTQEYSLSLDQAVLDAANRNWIKGSKSVFIERMQVILVGYDDQNRTYYVDVENSDCRVDKPIEPTYEVL